MALSRSPTRWCCAIWIQFALEGDQVSEAAKMGRSAKMHKRPNKKEKDNKLVARQGTLLLV